jgi:hypothetical protein
VIPGGLFAVEADVGLSHSRVSKGRLGAGVMEPTLISIPEIREILVRRIDQQKQAVGAVVV